MYHFWRRVFRTFLSKELSFISLVAFIVSFVASGERGSVEHGTERSFTDELVITAPGSPLVQT